MTSGEKRLSSDIADLNAIINAAACDVSRWADVAQSLQRLIPGSKILFQVVEKRSATVLQVVHSGFDHKTIQAYGDHYWKVNPWTRGANEMQMSSFRSSSELYPDNLLRKTEFFNDFVKLERECDGATALKFAAHRDRYALLAIHHDLLHHEQIHARSQAVLRTVVPNLRTALEVNRLTNPAFNLSGGRGLIDQLVDAAMIVDDDCRLLGSNAAANAFLADPRLVLIRAQDKLEIRNSQANAAFARLVRDSCAAVQDRARPNDLIVNTPSGGYIITCVPIAIDQTGSAAAGLLSIFAPRTAALIIIRPHLAQGGLVGIDHIRRHFGLTKSEAGLIVEFERGGTLSEIAHRVGVSRSTVQSHLKSIFAKTGTSKQRDVVTLVTRQELAGRQFFIDD